MDCSVLLLRHLYSAGKRVCIAHNNCMSCPSIWATLSSLIYFWVPSSCFYRDRLRWLSRIQRCRSPGRLHYPRRRRGGFTRWLTDCFDVQPTTTSGNIITQSIISLASANSFVYFASSAATSRWRICMSVIAAFASFNVWHFCRAGLCR